MSIPQPLSTTLSVSAGSRRDTQREFTLVILPNDENRRRRRRAGWLPSAAYRNLEIDLPLLVLANDERGRFLGQLLEERRVLACRRAVHSLARQRDGEIAPGQDADHAERAGRIAAAAPDAQRIAAPRGFLLREDRDPRVSARSSLRIWPEARQHGRSRRHDNRHAIAVLEFTRRVGDV